MYYTQLWDISVGTFQVKYLFLEKDLLRVIKSFNSINSTTCIFVKKILESMLLSLIVIQLLAIVANAANLQASPYWNAVKSESELENMITSETRNVLVFYHVSNRKCADCDKYAKS